MEIRRCRGGIVWERGVIVAHVCMEVLLRSFADRVVAVRLVKDKCAKYSFLEK